MTNLLDLDGKELEKELAKIIEKNREIYPPWTPKEVEILKKLYLAGVPHKKIAEVLGRPIAGMRYKIFTLGFSRAKTQ